MSCHPKPSKISRKILGAAAAFAFAAAGPLAAAETYDGKKILFVDSYHEGYAWSDGTLAGVRSVLDSSGAELRVVRMDTKRKKTDEDKLTAARMVKQTIESFRPDVVIASDDNASKYVIEPFYKDAAVPFVFCGVNWDASIYGFPYSNVTGMVEVASVDELFVFLERLTDGRRVGYLAADVFTAHKEQTNIEKTFGMQFAETRYVSAMDEWLAQFRELQDKVDILLVGNAAGTEGWDDDTAARFVERHTRIPSGAVHPHMVRFALIAFTKLAEEQGEWAARTALRILDGTPPSAIPISRNTRGRLIINERVAGRLGGGPMVVLDDMRRSADEVIE
ncbi:MAG: hypothetical protein JSU82_13210 [Rhodospirillales bacterium]|nr:MAG: hypothetical protein JSU82_13210 [Rhodospirillales bacterium]